MMLRYKFYKQGIYTTVNVELIDNLFVQQWKNYFIDCYKKAPGINWLICMLATNKQYFNEKEIIAYLARLYSSFLFLKKKNISTFENEINRIEHLFKNPHELNQADLNVWHRHFTTLEFRYSNKPDRTPPNTLTMDLYEYIHDINQFSHMCEGFTYYKCPRRQKFNNKEMYAVQYTNASNMAFLLDNDNHKISNNSETPPIPKGSYDFFKEGTDYTVWLNEDIIGKDQVKAWLDGDDLSNRDVDGNECMTPSVIFDPNKLYQSVINDEDFREESRRSGKTLDRPPLGNISNLSEIVWDNILGGKVVSIELDNQLLWNYKV